MLAGKSVWHVNQNLGKCFSASEIQGYYNNMTEKVTKMPELLHTDKLPQLPINGEMVNMPVAIFQYGLGAYDLYLQSADDVYLNKFMQTVDWAVTHQDERGRWNNFFYVYPEHPYGAMAQGEGVSLLLRAYVHTGESQYKEAAKRAIDFMLLPIEKGGTTVYNEDEVIFKEYTHLPVVMNGWVFAWWGLYDYVLSTGDKGNYKETLEQSCETLIKMLPLFKRKFWSQYDLSGRIASPFYHNLHVAQMQAMYQLTRKDVFNQYAFTWKRQQCNVLDKSIAFMVKALQKLKE